MHLLLDHSLIHLLVSFFFKESLALSRLLTNSHVAEEDIESLIVPPPLPKCQDYRRVLPCPGHSEV